MNRCDNFGSSRPLGFSKILLALAFLVVGSFALAESYTWQSVPIGGGGYVTGVEFHPTEKGLVYARTDVGGAYRWDEPSRKWIALNDGIPKATRDDAGVLSIGLDPSNTNRVYLLSGLYIQDWAPMGAILISEDRGLNWERVALDFRVGGNESGRGAGERLAIDPNLPSRLFVGSNNKGLWKSENFGKNWEKVDSFKPSEVMFVKFENAEQDKGKPSTTIFVGVNDLKNSLYRSDDAGQTWQAVPKQPTGIIFRRTALVGEGLYLAGGNAIGPNGLENGGVWLYNTRTGHWKDLAPPKGMGGFGGVSVDPNNPKRIIVSTLNRWHPKNEVYLTEDGGANWHAVLTSGDRDVGNIPYVETHTPHWLTDIKLDPFNPKRAMFVTGYGIYETQNLNTETPVQWRFESEGIEETVILEMISPTEGAPLLSVMGDVDGFKHDDLTLSPPEGRLKPELGSNNSIAFAYSKPKIMARTIERTEGIHAAISEDGGDTWTQFKSQPEGAWGGQIALSANAKTLLWTPQNGDTYYSKDRGNTWHKSEGLPRNLKPVADTKKSKIFYAYDAEVGQIYLSKNRGVSFSKVAGGLPKLPSWRLAEGNLRAVPGKKGQVYITTGKGVYFSKNYGRDVRALSQFEESYLVTFGKAKPGSKDAAIYVWGKVGGNTGIYRSNDAAKSWHKINDDYHQFGILRCMTGDLRVYGRLYLGLNGRGIMVGNIDTGNKSKSLVNNGID